MLFDGRNTLVYDYSNRPVSIENETYLINLSYDALGRRISTEITKKATGEKEIEYYYLDGARVIEDLGPNDEVRRTYVYGNGIDEMLMMERWENNVPEDRKLYYHENALGSITHISNEKGEIEESYKYEAYGKVTIYDERGKERKKSRFKNRYLFTGREYNSETGLYYYRARYYSAEMGRFLQRDTVRDDILLNLYTYVRNSPMRYIDPEGFKAKHLLTLSSPIGHYTQPIAEVSKMFTYLIDGKLLIQHPTFSVALPIIISPFPFPAVSGENIGRPIYPFLSSIIQINYLASYYPFGMTSAEFWLALRHPLNALKVRQLADEALKEVQKEYPDSLHNGKGDACRHVKWSALMTREKCAKRAKEWGDAHEDFPDNPPAEKEMDLHNNKVGRDMASDPKNKNKTPHEIAKEAVESGKVKTLE
jgi:RHS repeat-associated protein